MAAELLGKRGKAHGIELAGIAKGSGQHKQFWLLPESATAASTSWWQKLDALARGAIYHSMNRGQALSV